MAGKQNSSMKVISFVLVALFAVIALVLSYAAFSGTSLEFRSKAAETIKIVKAYEYNGATTEGWYANSGMGVAGLKTGSGYLSYSTTGLTSPTIAADNTSFTLPSGIKQALLSIRIAPLLATVTRPVTTPLPVQRTTSILKITPTSAPVSYPVPVEIHFYQKTATTLDPKGSPLKINAIADGKFHQYTVNFPDTLQAQQIGALRFVTTIKTPIKIDIDYLRFSRIVSSGIPPDCRAQAVTCLKAPCPTVLVCPTRPVTPTPPQGCTYQTPNCTLNALYCRLGYKDKCIPCAPMLTCPRPTPMPQIPVLITVTPTSYPRIPIVISATPGSYTCPAGGYSNCMPGPDLQSYQCTSAYQVWAKANCPGYKGVAY